MARRPQQPARDVIAAALPPRGVPARAPVHPGRLLARLCLAPLSLNQSEAARVLGMSRRRLHELVHGQRAMSPDTAIRCARQFGIDAGFWLGRQAAWDSFHAWQRQRLAR
ncbi:MAG: HigA family addiction module antidote protein [Hydrogenophaga sp.]|uniref:HigA family addiction module antitoxin n=1 Tax=Hydrogenophaga sp. TaxID=1904254 RepID=UPI001DDA8693|nr:HigA family addiction module antitoxin [Hydrogenophaga sp.]MBX3609044.1 HigA family addiction module antidote protein [Hydrogenophaga sp.]